ncbi:Lipopolysaccharide export system ATP-binding protein LptB [Rubrobacter xylanophilus DSM 9941]|uniref:ABC transporter ATP-binding protein n=1 Tax=Rubrobacter xylanophilus TaxID=49319 RepID=UPI001C644471|nr:ABC transporter ATP-binding protein [Rubrobacter xylanophilus]QYJ16423.1 Lipopolysaccharide export system ATP-binding protein LptB [Rubrobacter xylanophilus DSM 9941]
MSLLAVDGVSKAFGSLQVLSDVSFEVQPGQRHVIIGPNGAGKTTVFKCITGLLPVDSGSIAIDGTDVTGLPAHSRVSLGLACTFQKTNLFGELTVEENLHLAVTARKPYRFRIWKPLSWHEDLHRETRELLEEWGLWSLRERRVGELSYGEQRMLEIVLALASRPRILLLDEPTSGMSPAETSRAASLIKNLPRSVALLIIEHDMDVVFSVAEHITVLHHGEVFLSGSPERVRGDERVREIYFSGGARPHA